jgi:hypothetical protein
MSKNASILIAAACVISTNSAWADGATTNSTKPQKSSSGMARLPIKVLGFVTGAIVGTPICMVRKSIDEQKYAIDGIVGDHDTKVWKFCAGTFWLPFSVVTGVAESPVSSTFISFKNSDKPFSKSQFSIADVHPGGSDNSTAATTVVPGPRGPINAPADQR